MDGFICKGVSIKVGDATVVGKNVVNGASIKVGCAVEGFVSLRVSIGSGC